MKYVFWFLALFLSLPVFAQNLEIIPDTNDQTIWEAVERVGNEWGSVWDNYNKEAEKLQEEWDLGAQMASGIFTWDTLLDYLAYLIKFLSEVGIFVGACFIIYAWYLYSSHIFTGKDPSSGNKAIKNAILGVVVITFSYAIMKAITAAFLT